MPKPLWVKMLVLCSLAGLTTLARTEAHKLFQTSDARAALDWALNEVAQVARASGVNFTDEDLTRGRNFALNQAPGFMASLHRDLLAGKRLEIDALSGAIVRLGREKGIATPVHLTIYSALKPFAEGISSQ